MTGETDHTFPASSGIFCVFYTYIFIDHDFFTALDLWVWLGSCSGAAAKSLFTAADVNLFKT